MHDGARQFIAEQAAERGPFRLVLEIGSRDINGSVHEFFVDAEYLGIDKQDGNGVDVVTDALEWAPDAPPDCIVCCEVFEHEPRWRALIGRFAHWLAPEGCLLLTMAGPGREPHSSIDGGVLKPDEQYENISPEDLVNELETKGFTVELDLRNRGDIYALAYR